MRYSLENPFFSWQFDRRVFGEPSGGAAASSSKDDDDDKPAKKTTLTKADNTIGQVSKTGQYAGDGFEWVETTTSGGTQFLTRTYTGKGKDNGLGQDVRFGNTAQRDEKEAIAKISLDEGSAFAASPASATDIPANEIGIPTGFFPESDSYAEQVGQTDYKPTVKYIQPVTGGLGVNFDADAVAKTIAAEPAVDTTPDTSPRPKPRPEPEPEPVETGPAFDYTGVSMGELGRGAPEGTLPPGTVNYAGGVDPEMEVLSALKNSSSDPVGEGLMNTGEYLAATKYENDKADSPALAGTQFASAGNLSGLATDFSPLTIPLMDETVTKLDPMSAQEASFDQPSGLGLTDDDMGLPSEPVDFSQFEPKESLKDSIIKVLGGEDIISRAVTPKPLRDAQKAISTGIVEGAGTVGVGLGQTYDQMFRQDDDPLTPYDESGLYKAGEKVFDFGREMSDKFSEMSDSYEGDQEIYKNLKSYEDAVGYGPGQVDRTLLQAAGKQPGDIVQMGPDTGFDFSTAVQKGLKGAGSTALPLIVSTVNPLLGIGTGAASIKGELSLDLNNFIDNDPRIVNTELYQKALAANNGDDALARNAIKQMARGGGGTDLAALGLGGGGTAAQVALLSKANPLAAILGTGAIEAAQEGPGESFATNRILNTLMPELNLPMDKKDILEASTAGLGGGVTVAGPITGIQQLAAPKGPDVTTEGPAQPGGDQTPGSDQAFVPTSATAGQTATDPAGIQTEYEKAAGLDTTPMRPEIAPDRVTVAEMLMDQQLEDQGAIDVTDLQDLGLTLEEMQTAADRAITNRMDKDAKMLRALAEDSVVNTGGISAELVEEMNAKLDSAVVARITQEAFNNPLVTKEGETRVDLGIQKAAIEAALQRPPSGIEQAMLPSAESQPEIDTTPPSPFTPEGRAQIEAQTGPSKVNLSPAENVEGTTNIPAVEQTVAQEEQTKDETTPFIPVIEQTTIPSEDDEEETVEVEVDDTPETETETGATVEIDLPFVPPEIVKDEDGNDSFKCPDDTYTLVAGPDGPICKKTVERTRMRAGRSLSPYTRLNIPEGYKGPGQKRKTVTSVETAPVSS